MSNSELDLKLRDEHGRSKSIQENASRGFRDVSENGSRAKSRGLKSASQDRKVKKEKKLSEKKVKKEKKEKKTKKHKKEKKSRAKGERKGLISRRDQLEKLYGSTVSRPQDVSSPAVGIVVRDADDTWAGGSKGLNDSDSGESSDESGPVVLQVSENRVLLESTELKAADSVAKQKEGSGNSSDNDLFPPRRRARADSGDSDLSPPRQKARADSSDSDLSVPRRKARADSSDSDLSVPRRKARADSSDSDLSVPRRKARADSSDSDLSVPRRKARASSNDSDLSVPRRKPRAVSANSVSSNDQVKMSSGLGVGLRTGTQIAEELAKVKGKETVVSGTAVAQAMGENAQTVYRDKEGRKVEILDEYLKSKDSAKSKEALEAELKYEWATGAADRARAKAAHQELEDAKKRSLAVYADDRDLNASLRAKVRADDPMAAFLAFKSISSSSSSSSTTPVARKIYTGPPAPPNRFGIPPGYRWDGVDRTNGFEAKLRASQSARDAVRNQHLRDIAIDM